jgi:hypothetical protein
MEIKSDKEFVKLLCNDKHRTDSKDIDYLTSLIGYYLNNLMPSIFIELNKKDIEVKAGMIKQKIIINSMEIALMNKAVESMKRNPIILRLITEHLEN